MPRIHQAALLALAAAAAAPALAARSDNPWCSVDPRLDPANDLCNPLRYIPNLPLNVVAAVLYFIAAIIFTWHQFRYKGKYFICLVVGTWTEAIGLVLRIAPLRSDPHSLGGYIAMYMLVVLSPCAFLAADYILLGRLARHLNAGNYLFISPDRVSWIFVISDIVTFLIQATGGGMSTADTLHTAGSTIFLVGLILQLISFALFSALCLVFWYRTRRDTVLWNRPGWKPLFAALGFTCIMFLIRSFFRVVELSEGYAGYLATHEPYWAGLDCLPLWLGIMVYTYFWPYKFLSPQTAVAPPQAEVEYGDSVPASDMSVHEK